MQTYDEIGALAAALKYQGTLNKVLHNNIKQLNADKDAMQDEMDRRAASAGAVSASLWLCGKNRPAAAAMTAAVCMAPAGTSSLTLENLQAR